MAVSKSWVDLRSRVEYLRRLAIVFADELRLKIVTELYLREMSPKQFYEEFGGGSISRVDRHFKRLAEHGWLEFIRAETGGRRRGGTEHFYRATELAIFDNETWALLPYSMKVEYSWTIFKQLAERVTEGMKRGTFDARPDRHLGWSLLTLDRVGWQRVIAAVDGLFEFLFEEQEGAKLRVFDSGEQPILTTVALAGFESPLRRPHSDAELVGSGLAEGVHSPIPINLRLAKVFADELCLRIVAELNLREMSALQFHREFGGASADGIRRRFKMLAEIGWLTKVGQKSGGRRRGASEHFYRATGPATLEEGPRSELPDSIATSPSWEIFEQLSVKVKEAMEAGTFDNYPDRHLSWSSLRLDQLGWEKVISRIEGLSALALEEEKRARDRLKASGEEPIAMTVALAAFESPKDAKAP